MMKNPKTTIYGILVLLSAVAGIGAKLLLGKPLGVEDIAALSAALAAVGLISAQDGGA